jgi:hypothetical protein
MTALMTPEELRQAVAAANISALLMAVFQLMGDRRWLGERYRVRRAHRTPRRDTAVASFRSSKRRCTTS